ncbi:MAG: response regulator transcription factor [Bacteroidota bacterium]
MTKGNILIVEDDLNLGFLLMEYLETESFQVKLCREPLSGLTEAKSGSYDLAVLDVMLPHMDGFTLAQHIRDNQPGLPFLFLSARSLKPDRLKGYAVGAEDYLTKPFDEEELSCKIQVILRRKRQAKPLPLCETIQLGDFRFNHSRQELTYGDVIQRLTEKESAVLHLLCQHQNRILRRDEAVEKIYGKKDYFLGRSFDVFISRLRKLLKQDPRIQIENVFKVGFILQVHAKGHKA